VPGEGVLTLVSMEAQPDKRSESEVVSKSASSAPGWAALGPWPLLGIALAGAVVLLAVQSILMAIFAGQSIWKTTWVLGAVFMGRDVLHWPAVFDFAACTAALTALYPTTLVCAVLLSGLTCRVTLKWAILAGAVVGGLFYIGDLYGFTRLFPWLVQERNGMAAASLVILGVVTAWLLRQASAELA
jgi:hypothetical protein